MTNEKPMVEELACTKSKRQNLALVDRFPRRMTRKCAMRYLMRDPAIRSMTRRMCQEVFRGA